MYLWVSILIALIPAGLIVRYLISDIDSTADRQHYYRAVAKYKKGKKKGKKFVKVEMAVPQLSSNWKKLQQKLKGDVDDNSKITKKRKPKKLRSKTDNGTTTTLEKSTPKKDPEELVKLTRSGTRSVADILLAEDINLTHESTKHSIDSEKKKSIGKYLAVDCEFVGVGRDGSRSVLARVSIVNYYGHVVLDKFVKPSERVTDWRTWVSGVRPSDVRNAESFATVQAEVAELFQGKILVGHAIQNDLKALMVSHPKSRIRDTSLHRPFRKVTKGPPALKKLAEEILQQDIQSGSHSSIEDAQATMLLFRLHKHQFDNASKKAITN